MSGSIDLESRVVSRVALSGRDYRGVNFELLCQPGDVVQAGAAVMRDTRRPEIMFAAPVAGRVAKIERGARRKLISLQIDVDESAGAIRYEPPTTPDRASMRDFLLESGRYQRCPAVCMSRARTTNRPRGFQPGSLCVVQWRPFLKLTRNPH
jgi:Na+-transporting NADH:ubiquinone oxidoreductase subunit NqrA